MANAEPRNDTASTTMATGAVSAWISSPPSAGPAMNDPDRVALSSEFAWRYWSRRTSRAKNGG